MLLKLAVGAASVALCWWGSGWMGGLVSLAFLGRLFARDLVDLGGFVLHQLRARAMAPVQGRFYAFKGHRVEVVDDDVDRVRWLAVDHLAAALGEPISERALSLRHAAGLRRVGTRLFLRDEEALAYLGERQAERALALRHWLRREVWHPARGRAANYEPAVRPAPTLDTPTTP